MPERIQLLVCQNFLEDAAASVTAGGTTFEGVTVSAFPSRCGRPPLSIEELRKVIPGGDPSVQVVGSVCLSAIPADLCGSCRTTRFPSCFELVADRQLVGEQLRQGAFLVTPGWLARWREHVAVWGFGPSELREFLHETVKRIHLLDTGTLPDVAERLREFAEQVRLPFGTTWVGTSHLELHLKGLVLARRLELQRSRSEAALRHLRQKSADYAMAIDLLGRFAAAQDEREAIARILEVFSVLFAPKQLAYVTFEEGRPAVVHSTVSGPRPPDDETLKRIGGLEGDDLWEEEDRGFLLRIGNARGTLGVAVVDGIAFPEFGSHYRNLIRAILPVCGLSVSDARDHEELVRVGAALREANQQLARLASLDGLTGIANRRYLDERLAKECRLSVRERTPLSVVLVDVDHFKLYNDTHGHLAGDESLKRVARLLSRSASRPGDLASRYGGEEFAMVLPGTPPGGAFTVAERIRAAVLQEEIPHGASPVGPFVTLSLGVATLVARDAADATRVVALADEALYEAKRSGRNRTAARVDPSFANQEPGGSALRAAAGAREAAPGPTPPRNDLVEDRQRDPD